MDARKSRFAPNTPDPLCAKDTRHLTHVVRNGSIRRSPHPWHRLSLKFGIFIWGRNSSTCQKNRAITDLLNKTKIRQVHYCSGPYICHTNAMTTIVEYGTRCLYEDINFYFLLIVTSVSWLKLKSSHFRKCFEKNFFLCVRLMQNRMEILSTAAKLFVWRLRPRAQKAQSPHYWQMGGKNLKSVNHYKYLGAVLNTELLDDKDIQRQLRLKYCAANKLRASVSRCSKAVKNVLFRSFCTPMYASQIWWNFRKSCMQRLRVAYNFGCRDLHNLPWRPNISSHDSSVGQVCATFFYSFQ